MGRQLTNVRLRVPAIRPARAHAPGGDLVQPPEVTGPRIEVYGPDGALVLVLPLLIPAGLSPEVLDRAYRRSDVYVATVQAMMSPN